jgi:hypothetical protein
MTWKLFGRATGRLDSCGPVRGRVPGLCMRTEIPRGAMRDGMTAEEYRWKLIRDTEKGGECRAMPNGSGSLA